MKPVTLDFETYWATDYTLSKMTTQTYILDPRFKAHGCGFKLGDKPTIWVPGPLLPAFFAQVPWHNVALFGHNLQFDGSILAWRYGFVPKLYVDTLGISRALVGQRLRRHSLDNVAAHVLGWHKMDGLAKTKDYYDLPKQIEADLIDYCIGGGRYNPDKNRMEAGDCELTWRLAKKFMPLMPEKELLVQDWVLRKFTKPSLMLNEDRLRQYHEEVVIAKHNLLRRVGLHTTEVIEASALHGKMTRAKREATKDSRGVLMSNDTYAGVLKALGVVPPTKVNAKGKVTFAFAKTDEEHKALLEHDNPLVQAIVAARLGVKSTIEETRAVNYIRAAGLGPWPVAYNYSGAYNTHRLSGNKGGGGNPTNLKRGGTLRKCIVAPPGKRIGVFDQSQIECRMTMWMGALSRRSRGMEKEALETFRRGEDMYSKFAGMIYGRRINKKDDPDERQVGKSATLGLGFGMGSGRFEGYALEQGAKGVNGEVADAAVALYRQTYTGVVSMWYEIEKRMKALVWDNAPSELGPLRFCYDPLFGDPAITTDGGLYLKYNGLRWGPDGDAEYADGKIFGGKWMENVVQHVCRNVLVRDAILEIERADYEVVMTTYDEVVILVDDTDEAQAEATRIVEGIMTKEHPMFPGLPLAVEYGFGYNYGDAKK